MEEDEHGVPEQRIGEKQSAVERRCFDTIPESKQGFNVMRKQLMDIGNWQELCENMSAGFTQITPEGKECNDKPTIGNFIKINIKGLGSRIGDNYDWVKIIKLDENPYDKDERYFLQCKPSFNPTDRDGKKEVKHFYSDKASISFIVYREEKCVTVKILGRNEVKNDDTSKLMNKIRNSLIALGGKMGMGLIQWNKLAEGLINIKI